MFRIRFRISRHSLIALAALVCLAGVSAQAQTRIRLATLAPKGTSFHRLLLTMGEKWAKAPNGGVALVVYPDGTMGGEPETIRRMRVGQIQAAMLTSAGLAEIDPTVMALEALPMMYRSPEEVDYVRQHLAAGIEKRMEDRGFVVLGWATVGFAHFFSKQPGLQPQDFMRMKMYVSADDAAELQVLSSIGGHPVGLDWTNTLTALQTGMVDVVPTMPVHALAAQFNTATSHMLDVKWAPVTGGIVISKKAWDALPQAERDSMKQSAEEAAKGMQDAGFAENAAAVAAMQKRGLQVQSVSPQLQREWQDYASGTIWPKMRGTMITAATFDEVLRLVTEYRKQNGIHGL